MSVDELEGPPSPPKPKRTASGEHPLAEEARRIMATFERTTLAELRQAKDRLVEAMSGVPTLAPPPPTITDYTITLVIRARGPHHNGDENDANRLAMGYIKDLRNRGHIVESASFDSGVKEELTLHPDVLKEP
jgi:hypothetical protein